MALLVLAEATGWLALRHRIESIPATLILLGINLVIATIFGVLATRSSPGDTEVEALRVRREAGQDAAPARFALVAEECRADREPRWRFNAKYAASAE